MCQLTKGDGNLCREQFPSKEALRAHQLWSSPLGGGRGLGGAPLAVVLPVVWFSVLLCRFNPQPAPAPLPQRNWDCSRVSRRQHGAQNGVAITCNHRCDKGAKTPLNGRGWLVKTCWRSKWARLRTMGRTASLNHKKDHHLGIEIPLIKVGQIPIEHVQVILLIRVLVLIHQFFGLIQCKTSATNVFPAVPLVQLDSRSHESVPHYTACNVPRAAATSSGSGHLAVLPWSLLLIQTTSSLSFAPSLVTSKRNTT